MSEKVEGSKKTKHGEVSTHLSAKVAKLSGGTINVPNAPVALPSLPSCDTSRITVNNYYFFFWNYFYV